MYRSYPVTADTIVVPPGVGTPVLTDGVFSDGEWDDAAQLHVNDSITVFFKQQNGHVFIGVLCPELTIPVFDLFFDPRGGEIHQLHLSAQLGERILNETSEDAEDPAFVWGRTSDWYANEIRWDASELDRRVAAGADRDAIFGEVVFPYEGAEFQIKHSKFGGESWRMRLETVWHGSYDDPHVFPPETSRRDSADWIVLIVQ
jgi:hypothetical protein